MPNYDNALKRIQHLEELLDIEYEKLHGLEKALALAPPGPGKVALKQNIKRENWPEIRRLEAEFGRLLAETSRADEVAPDEAEHICAELSNAVSALKATKDQIRPADVAQKLDELHQKLSEPGKAATAKLKVSLPIIPLLVSYDLEVDTESTLVQIWGKVKALFKKAVPANP